MPALDRGVPTGSSLAPAQTEAARRIVDDIARAIVRVGPPADGDLGVITSLLTREPGFTLFYAYLDRLQPKPAWRRHGLRHLERAIARVPEQSSKPFFSYGFSGTAWALQHLAGWFVDVPDDMNGDIDAALLKIVEEAPTLSYDLQYGLVGFGLYALERLPHPSARALVERIVDRLARSAEARDGGLSWRTVNADWVVGQGVPQRLEKGVYAPAVFNGVAGVVGLLGGAIHHGIAVRRARRLLDGALSWLWSTRRGGLFPSKRQLSWSQGSLGIATVAFTAARAAGSSRWQEAALAVAHRLARASGATARLADPSLATGVAGAAHMFRRLHLATGDERFAAAWRHWTARLLRRRRAGRGLAGYATMYVPAWHRPFLDDPKHPIGWVGLPGISNGVAGIGLVLQSMIGGAPPDWDRMLLLSYR